MHKDLPDVVAFNIVHPQIYLPHPKEHYSNAYGTVIAIFSMLAKKEYYQD